MDRRVFLSDVSAGTLGRDVGRALLRSSLSPLEASPTGNGSKFKASQ